MPATPRNRRIHRVNHGSSTAGPVMSVNPLGAQPAPIVVQGPSPIQSQAVAAAPSSVASNLQTNLLSQGVLVEAENPAPIDIPAIPDDWHPGFIRNSPSGELKPAGGGTGGGYDTIEQDGTLFPQEHVLEFAGVGVNVTPGVDKTVVTFSEVEPVSASIAHSPSIVQAGASVVNPAFTGTYSDPPTTAVLTDTDGHNTNIISNPNNFVSPFTFTKNVYGASVTWTATVEINGEQATPQTSVTWAQPVKWGTVVDPGSYNSAFIAALSNTRLQLGANGEYAVNSSGGTSTFFAARSAYGLVVLDFQVNGLPFAIAKVGAAIPFTNSDGVTENYDVWMSDNINLGDFSFTCEQ